MLFFLGFNKCRKAEQASGRCSNLRTTFFTATGVTHPLSSARSSLYRPGNNELNQDRVSVLSLSLSHTPVELFCQKKKKKHNMNNLQPDLHSAPSLLCPWKRVKWRWVTRVPFFAYSGWFPEQKYEFWPSCAWKCSASTRGDHSRNRSLQSGCEMENTFTVRADECLSSND